MTASRSAPSPEAWYGPRPEGAASRGFTLVEMMVAVILGALVILGLAAIFATVLKFQLTGYKRDIIQGGGLLSLRNMTRDLQQATRITSPGSPCAGGNCAGSAATTSDVLSGCTNYEVSANALLDTNGTMRTFHYCVHTDRSMYYHWQETNVAGECNPIDPLGACDTQLGGWNISKVAEQAQRDGSSRYFQRPAGMNNVVELHYVVQTSTGGAGQAPGPPPPQMIINTSVAVQKSVTAPD